MNLFIIFLLPIVHAEVHFGALTIPSGHLVSVDEYVYILLDYGEFVNLPEDLEILRQRTLKIQENLPTVRNDSSLQIMEQLHDKASNIVRVLDETTKYFRIPPKQSRTKRGLINILGYMSKTLFGTATEEDVNLLNDKVDQLALILNDNIKSIQTTTAYNNKQTVLLNQIVSQFDELDTHLNRMKAEIYDLFYLLLSLDDLEFKSISLQNIIQQHLNDIAFSIQHVLSPNLLTPFDLKTILNNIEDKFNYNLSFVLDQIHLFYQIIEPFLIKDGIVLKVPVSSKVSVPLTLIHPFPSLFEDSAYILNQSDVYLAYSNQSLHYAEILPEILSQCKHLDFIYFCNSEILFWEHIGLTHTCLLDLITNTTVMPHSCEYFIFLHAATAVYFDQVTSQRYIFTKSAERGLITCNENKSVVNMNHTLVVHSSCSVVSPTVVLMGTKRRMIQYTKVYSRIVTKDFQNLAESEDFKSKLNKLTLAETHTTDFFYWKPVVYSSTSLFVILFITIFAALYVSRRWYLRQANIIHANPPNLAVPLVPESSSTTETHHVAIPTSAC